jgi:hypothetical protein
VNESIVNQALLNGRKEVGLEVNPEKTKYMLMSRSQKIAERSFEDVADFKYYRINTNRSKLDARRD